MQRGAVWLSRVDCSNRSQIAKNTQHTDFWVDVDVDVGKCLDCHQCSIGSLEAGGAT